MADTKILTLADLSDGEVEMLKLSETAKFSDDGKTVEIPKDAVDRSAEPPDPAALLASVRKLDAPPPPEHIAKRLAEGFEPPASSLSVEEDGKIVAGTAPAPREKIVANSEELADYVRCLLGGKPFTKTYEFMGGSVKATMRERTSDEDEDVIRRTAVIAAQQGQSSNPIMLTLLITKYRLAYSLDRLDLGVDVRRFERIPVGKLNEKAPGAYLIDQRVAEIGDFPSALNSALSLAVTEFSELIGDIARRAADPKSWQTPSAV